MLDKKTKYSFERSINETVIINIVDRWKSLQKSCKRRTCKYFLLH